MPSVANRGISAASRICACSMRSRSARAAGHLALHPLERVHRDAVATVANRVNGRLESGLRRRQRLRVDLLGRCRQQAGRRRLVGVGLEHRRAARSERAVGHDLDGADDEPRVRAAGDGSLVEERPQRRQRAAKHHVHPRLQSAGVDQRPVRVHRLSIGARVVHHRQPETAELLVGEQEPRLELRPGDSRDT